MNRIITILVIVLAVASSIFLLSRSQQAAAPSQNDSLIDSLGGSASPSDRKNVDPAIPQEQPLPVPSESGPWPRLTFEQTDFNFGRMQVGDELEHTFIIRNEGEAELELLAGNPTCKCTAFRLASEKVAPGEETTLLVRWVGKFRDPSFQHGGPIYSNDPKNESVTFTVRGIVDAAFDMLPTGTWDAGEVRPNSPTTFSAAIFSNVHEDFEVTSLDCKSEHVTLEAIPLDPVRLTEIKGIAGYEIKVTIDPTIKAGLFEDEVLISTNKSDKPQKVFIKARREGNIRLLATPGVAWSPNTRGLSLGQFAATEGRSAKLLLLVDETGMTEPFALGEITADPPFMTVSMEPAGAKSDNMGKYFLTVTIPPGAPRISRDRETPATVKIQTNLPNGEAIDLRARFRIF
jgi:hypothetical protein